MIDRYLGPIKEKLFPDRKVGTFTPIVTSTAEILGNDLSEFSVIAASSSDMYLRDHGSLALPELYVELAKLPLILTKKEEEGKTTYCGVCSPIDGGTLNALLYFSAPNKFYGLDTRDILTDWRNLYEAGYNEDRLERHRRIPEWEIFEGHRIDFLNAIKDWSKADKGLQVENPNPRFIPLMQWSSFEGKRIWDLDHPVGKRDLKNLNIPGSPRKLSYNRLLGLLYAAAYSPEITMNFPQEHGYPDGERRQIMGSTQALPMVIWKRDKISNSKFIRSIEQTLR